MSPSSQPSWPRRWFVWTALAICALILLLPTVLLQTPLGQWMVSRALAPVGLQIDIGSARGGWLVPMELRAVTLRTQDHAPLINAEAITHDRSLIGLLLSREELGSLEIDHPRIHLIITDEGTNFDFPQEENDSSPDVGDGPSGRRAQLRFAVNNAELLLKTTTMPQEARLLSDVDFAGTLRQTLQGKQLLLEPGKILDHTPISRDICEGVLKYVMPILSEVTWVQGDMSLELSECQVNLDALEESHVVGDIHVHAVKTGLKNPLAQQISRILAGALGRDAPTAVQLAESQVNFRVAEGRVWHEGLAFGLPEIAPDLQIRSQGSVGFDETLDLVVEVPLPLGLMGDGPLTKSLSDQTLQIPVGGTLSQPELRLDGQGILGGLLVGLGRQWSEGEEPILDLLRRVRGQRGTVDDDQQSLLGERLRQGGADAQVRRPLRRILDTLLDATEEENEP